MFSTVFHWYVAYQRTAWSILPEVGGNPCSLCSILFFWLRWALPDPPYGLSVFLHWKFTCSHLIMWVVCATCLSRIHFRNGVFLSGSSVLLVRNSTHILLVFLFTGTKSAHGIKEAIAHRQTRAHAINRNGGCHQLPEVYSIIPRKTAVMMIIVSHWNGFADNIISIYLNQNENVEFIALLTLGLLGGLEKDPQHFY